MGRARSPDHADAGAAPQPAVLRSPLAGDTLAVHTPEAVTIEYPLAGLGSRFAALFIDLLWLLLLLVVVPVVVAVATRLLARPSGSGPWVGLLVLYEVAVIWGYFFWFEAFRDGCTPGKRAMSIRVVLDGGYPVTVRAAAIRNLVRILDLQPGITCVVGGFFMLVSRTGRRLGDHAAGTVVVRDLPIAFPEVRQLPLNTAPPLLSEGAFTALDAFMDRYAQLQPTARFSMAARLAASMRTVAAPLTEETSLDYLRRLHAEERARRHAARLMGAGGTPAATALLANQRPRWTGFQRQVAQLKRDGLSSLDEHALVQFAAQYREVSSDLARARTYGASAETLFSLERLVGAAHNLFYRPAQRSLRTFIDFVTGGFPCLVRRLWLPIALAAVLLYVPALVTHVALSGHPDYERSLAGVELIDRADRAVASGSDYVDTIRMPWMGSTALSSMLIANNVQVSFVAFAGGALLGIGSLWILVMNGVLLGAATAVFANRSVLGTIGLWLAPHGLVELTAITIAGGAGLWMGSGLLLPGRRARLPAFAERAREAVALIAGVGLMLVVAGLLEGWVAPAHVSPAFKLLIAAAVAIGLTWYLLIAGRAAPPRDADPATAARRA